MGRVKISFLSYKKNSPFTKYSQEQKASLPPIYVPLAISHEVLWFFNVGKETVKYFKCYCQSSQSNRLVSKEACGC